MGSFDEYVAKTLGVKLPEEYSRFMERHGNKLAADPVHKESWAAGLGDRDFVIGTTLAFRSMLPTLGRENVVIGYVGVKTIVVNRQYEEIDEYLMLDTIDGRLLTIDARGIATKIEESFEEWIAPDLLRAELREKYTSKLTVIVFDDALKAEGARLKLLKLQSDGFIDLEDVVVVVKELDGAVRYHQMNKPARKGGLAGSITGLIVGSIFFTPLGGAVLGAIAGAISASLTDMGIDDRFMKDLSQKFEPGSSALFTLVRKVDPERVKEAFFGFGGKVLVNSVSKEREAAIQALLNSASEGLE